ncbi:MAG: hypothetical protein COS95_01240, partial [Ignavibacteriales bacterium CG07_land_8_20_14_0_80_59_12]
MKAGERNFSESLWGLIAQFGGEPLLKAVRSRFDEMQSSEAKIAGEAGIGGFPPRSSETSSAFPLDAVVTECDQALPKDDFFELV